MNQAIDQSSRERFVSELDKNFSVVAAAGSGKTRAITDRIVQIAKSTKARDWLPQLAVVAFTNRAADEMQQRARAEVLRARLPLEILAAFNRAFFGTIHAFCVRLLDTYGHYLGLPPKFEVIADDDEIWNEFVQQQTTIGRSLSDENRRELLRHIEARRLMELGRCCDLSAADPPPEECPDTDFSAVYRYPAKGSTLQTIPPYQKELKRAEERWRDGEHFVRWPVCWSEAKDFVPIKREAFREVRRWIDQAALCLAAEVRCDYRNFRIEHGFLTYEDQVFLALELTRHPKVGPEIREKSFRVILDEAQDTDPRQFSLLLELSRPPAAKGDWLEDRSRLAGPRPGYFCMVGDFQQSIYRDRSDLLKYRRIHETLVQTGGADALTFSVTFRLDTAQLDFVNKTFRKILNDRDHQVPFVELNPRPNVLPGQVVRLDLPAGNLVPDRRGKISEARKAAEEARQLGEWLRETGLTKLRAQTWRDVAILCPRKEWLQTLRRGLRKAGLNVQIQSEKEWKGDSPAYSWLTALLIIMARPRCDYEIVGLLRELFGISDHDLAVFSQGHGDRFQIETDTAGTGVVSIKLSLLAQIRSSILALSLFDAVTEIATRTGLRQRLNSLPTEDFEDLDGELDALLALAASSEAEGLTLTEFAELLRTHFADAREVRPSRTDSIQLITSQKAKGSEWQAVIVPFLTRDIRSPSPRYPRLVKNPDTGEWIVLLDRSDFTGEVKDLLERESRQEMERLLYVALTRARHTLVLAFDNELFAKKGGEVHSHSQSKWLRADKGEPNETVFANAAVEPASCDLTGDHYKARPKGAEQVEPKLLAAKIANGVATKNASVFIRKLNPSGLPLGELEERWARAESLQLPRPAGAALRYGLWWHDFVQQIPWTCSRPALSGGSQPNAGTATERRGYNAIFDQHRKLSPDPGRSSREWKLLLSHLSGSDDFRRDFSGNGTIIHSELPFLWRLDQSRCLEGVVDLALFHLSAKKCLILDWKTDRVPPDSPTTLRARYCPQLAAYWKAVREMTKMEVAAAIYSTAAGALIRYQTDELTREWERLEKLPADQLDANVRPDVDLSRRSDVTKPDLRASCRRTKSTQLEFTDL